MARPPPAPLPPAPRGVTFMAERIWRDSREFGGVFIHEEDESGKATTMTARHGRLSSAPQGETSTLFLVDGVRLESAPAENGRPASRPPASRSGVLTFDQGEIPIDLVGQEPFRPRGEDERELTLTELWHRRAAPPPGVATADLLAEFHDTPVRSLSVPFRPLPPVPLALGAPRARPTPRPTPAPL